MKAIVCHRFAPVEALMLDDIAPPEIGPDEVLIDVYAAGVNFPDGLIVQGKYQTKPPLPFVPGSEVSGIIAAVGRDVTTLVPGDCVVAFSGTGGFAEQARVSAAHVYRLPVGIDFTTVAGMLITYGTSYHALKDRAAIKAGETLLVLGAGGGVGLAAVELGAQMGARVIAVASSPEKLALARDYGAMETIDYASEDLRERVKALTDGKGVDIAFDPVGGVNSIIAVRSLAWGGRHLVVGFASGDIPAIPANVLLLKNAASLGVLWGMSLRADPLHHALNIDDLLNWLSQRRISPAIDTVFPLDRAMEAITHVMERRVRGKVVIALRPGQKTATRR